LKYVVGLVTKMKTNGDLSLLISGSA